jgi:hypothetical protein
MQSQAPPVQSGAASAVTDVDRLKKLLADAEAAERGEDPSAHGAGPMVGIDENTR